MEIFLSKLATALVLPPGFNIAAGLAGLCLLKRRRRTGLSLLLISLVSLYLLSIPWLARTLVSSLEAYPPLALSELEGREVGAIVVLGGGLYPKAPEYGKDTLGAGNLPRLRFAAHLHRETGLPILVTGGSVHGYGTPEGVLMKAFLERELKLPVTWLEDDARNTAENARLSRTLLEQAGIDEVVVVTHAWHMPRAVEAFERVGMVVAPAPVEFRGPMLNYAKPLRWLPHLSALGWSTTALHEYIGRLWYWIRY